MKKKIITFLVFAAFFYAVFWVLVNYFFIPKVVVPKVTQYVAEFSKGPVKLAIKEIRFAPVRGFILKDVSLAGPMPIFGNHILDAKLVDVDIEMLPLLWRHLVIRSLNLYDADFSIGRDETGIWNFQPLLEQDTSAAKSASGDSFLIKGIRIKKGLVDYADYFKKENALKKRLSNVDLIIRSPKAFLYEIIFSGSGENRLDDSIAIKMTYDMAEDSLEGKLKLNTRHIEDYWTYYLDELLKPWHMKADKVGAAADFKYEDDVLDVSAEYKVDKCILAYGDLSVKGDAFVNHKIKYAKNAPEKDVSDVEIFMKNVSSLSGNIVFLEKGECDLIIDRNGLVVKRLVGTSRKQPVELRGKFDFGPKRLYLTGKVSNTDNIFNMNISPDNTAVADWQIDAGKSHVKLHADISDLKDQAFDLKVDGNIELPRMFQIMDFQKGKVSGSAIVTGDIKGEADEPSLLQGQLALKVIDLSIMDLESKTFDSAVAVKDGVFSGEIPQMDFHKGTIDGNYRFTFKRWGLQLNAVDTSVEEIASRFQNINGAKGSLSANIASVSDWGDIKTTHGGGYIKLEDLDINGVKTVTSEMPVFKKIEGNFKVEDQSIRVEDTSFKSGGKDYWISGRLSFDGDIDATLGISTFGGGAVDTVKKIFSPLSLGKSLIASPIRITINGRLPNYKKRVDVQPAQWVLDFFKLASKADPGKYSLEDVWNQ